MSGGNYFHVMAVFLGGAERGSHCAEKQFEFYIPGFTLNTP